MGVAAAEFLGAVDAERVIPDHPAPAGEVELFLKEQLQLGGIRVAYRQPKRARRFQDTNDLAAPAFRPSQVLLGVVPVFVDVVIVPDVERGVSEDEIH